MILMLIEPTKAKNSRQLLGCFLDSTPEQLRLHFISMIHYEISLILFEPPRSTAII